MFGFSKGDLLTRIQNIFNIKQEDTLVVGDGANDISMFKHAGTRVAFCAKEVLKKEANIIIEEKNLTKIIDKL
jgi:phosphoserine phosphatase